MVKFRVGKGYLQTCPACPRTTNVDCLNPLTETDSFTLGDQVFAIYETQCQGNTLGTESAPYSFTWYQWQHDSSNDTWSWVALFTWTPGGIYPTATESHYTPSVEGCYKVEYRGLTDIAYTKQFSVGTHEGITCPAENVSGDTNSVIIWIIIGILIIAILAWIAFWRK